MAGLMTFAYMRQTGQLVNIDEMCQKHGIYKVERYSSEGALVGGGAWCMECAKDALEAKKRQTAIDETLKSKQIKSYHVFYRESTVVPELKKKDLSNFEIKTDADRDALDFARRVARDYQKGREGNTLMMGDVGTGKSHLALGIAKDLNQQYKTYDENGSVIFISVATLISKVKSSFDGSGYYTEQFAKELLTNCDYLVLDDLGKESTSGNQVKSASAWVYQFLFDIIDRRKNTIVTTNFSQNDLVQIYDRAFVDRLKKGAKGYIHTFSGESKR